MFNSYQHKLINEFEMLSAKLQKMPGPSDEMEPIIMEIKEVEDKLSLENTAWRPTTGWAFYNEQGEIING